MALELFHEHKHSNLSVERFYKNRRDRYRTNARRDITDRTKFYIVCEIWNDDAGWLFVTDEEFESSDIQTASDEVVQHVIDFLG